MTDVEKYRQAAVIAQSGLLLAIKALLNNIGEVSIGEICRNVDSVVSTVVQDTYKDVQEKGIALPLEICKNEFVSGVSPESSDTFQGGVANVGDIISVSLGVHIDGHTVQAARTIVVREGDVQHPVSGKDMDALVATFMCVEALISLLGATLSDSHPLGDRQISGHIIRELVEAIAKDFDCHIVPGSRVRRIQPFVAGQPSILETNARYVEWSSDGASKDLEWVAQPGDIFLIDILMASKHGLESSIKIKEFTGFGSLPEGPTLYQRDYTVSYGLKMPKSRALLAKVDQRSVYPFKLSYVASDEAELRAVRLGLSECVQRRLLIEIPRLRAFLTTSSDKKGSPVPVAREMTTVALVSGRDSSSGYPEVVRFGGGKQIPPSWIHSEYEVSNQLAKSAMEAYASPDVGVRLNEVTGRLN